ncbi:MAG: hypothetical protein Q8Q31_03905 [Nanoarchaeota archaeon]|nr:hypothetical protein [Nanoarchaeota archaeon]
MTPQTAQAIARLNEWYSEKTRRTYTTEAAQEVQTAVKIAVKEFYEEEKIEEGERLEEGELEQLLGEFSRENIIRAAETHYSTLYALREMYNSGEIKELGVKFSRGFQQEYLQPVEQSFAPFMSLIEKIQKSDIPPAELDNTYIDGLFKEAFPTPELYVACLERCMKETSIVSDRTAKTEEDKFIMRLMKKIFDKTLPISVRMTIREIYS